MRLAERSETSLRWWQGLTRYHWVVLTLSALGWLFDTMDQNLFNLVRQPSVRDLILAQGISGPLQGEVNRYGGYITSIFLVGWALGGFLFGMLGDRLGRTRAMILTILIYAGFTGLSGIARSWQELAFYRFMTALGVGGEWAAGASLVAEVFPERSRPMALGFLQALSAVGNMMAAVVTLVLAQMGLGWRAVFWVGALPALLVFWIRRSLREPERWQKAKEAAIAHHQGVGAFRNLFRDPLLRRNTIVGTLMAVAGVGGLWGIGFWSPDLLTIALKGLPEKSLATYRSITFFVQQVGAALGMYTFTLVTEKTNRRFAFVLFFLLSFLALQGTFHYVYTFWQAMLWFPVLGFCTLGPFAGYTVYFPELFPTRLRATGCGVCYNGGRFLAALAPFALGALSVSLGSIRIAASVVAFIYLLGIGVTLMAPETKGKPLPD